MAARDPNIERLEEAFDLGLNIDKIEEYVQMYDPEFTLYGLLVDETALEHKEDKTIVKMIKGSILAAMSKYAEKNMLTGNAKEATRIMKQSPEEFLHENRNREDVFDAPVQTSNEDFMEEMTMERIDENAAFESGEIGTDAAINKTITNLENRFLEEVNEAVVAGGTQFDPAGLAQLQKRIAESSRPRDF